MLDEREAFEEAIRQQPELATLRFVFADWLLEHGEDKRSLGQRLKGYELEIDNSRIPQGFCAPMATTNIGIARIVSKDPDELFVRQAIGPDEEPVGISHHGQYHPPGSDIGIGMSALAGSSALVHRYGDQPLLYIGA